MIPAHYFYLVDIETEEPLAIFSTDDLDHYLHILTREAELRTKHRVDDPDSGLALRDSALRPLPATAALSVMARQRRRA